MELKTYQQKTLDVLGKFLAEARTIGSAAAFTQNQNAPSYRHKYISLPELEDAPYICLRLPTGGGKTLLGAYSIKIAAENFLYKEYPLVLWLVPTDTIRQQTLKNLRDTNKFYWQALDASFKDRVKIFDVTEFRQLRPQDLTQSLNIFVATFQSFRVTNTEGRKVYQPNEYLEPCFRNLPNQEKSFGNLISLLRPLMIIDEAHNYSSPLSLKIMQKLKPAAIIELTATPAQENSNVLYQVSATELKDAEMIKLPIMLAENHSWEMTIDSAVQKRTALEVLAAQETDYIRPIALFQAESKDKEVTVDVVKKYLLEGAKVPENQIAIATGERRELDGVDLSARDCPIRYVITVQALKEGWDCSFAYVFCSVAKVHSPKDAEQLLGRVLRMPKAKRRNMEELNRAYAFVAVETWTAAAAQIRDDLSIMGFENAEAMKEVRQATIFDTKGIIKITTSERPQLSNLNSNLQGAAFIEKTSEGYELILKDISCADKEELAVNVNKIFEKEHSRVELLKAIHWQDFIPKQADSPAARGVKFEIPMLCLDFGDEAVVADMENFLPENWRLTDKYDTDLSNFVKDVTAQIYEFDVVKHKVTEKYLGDNTTNLFYGETNWTFDELVSWLVYRIPADDIADEDITEFVRRTLVKLQDKQDIALDELVRLRFTLLKCLKEKINACRDLARKEYWVQSLFGVESVACIKPDITRSFTVENYPVRNFYSGCVRFQKHFYSQIANMNAEEVRCAQLIDTNKNVETWIRNIDSQPDYSFWLPTHDGKFYPDFVVKLTDGTYAAIEYKGKQLENMPETKEKKLIGELWERLNGGKFLMAMMNDERGRDLSTQIREFFS